MRTTIDDAGLCSVHLWGESRSLADLAELAEWVRRSPTLRTRDCRSLGVFAGLMASRQLRATGQTVSVSNAYRAMDEYYLVFGMEEANEAFSEGVANGVDAVRRDATIAEIRELLRRC